MSHLIPWSRNGGAPQPQADNTSQLLTQAGTQIGAGDLAGAVATVKQIDAAQQEVLADWIEDANARVAADALAQRLSDQIAQRATGASTAKPVKTQ